MLWGQAHTAWRSLLTARCAQADVGFKAQKLYEVLAWIKEGAQSITTGTGEVNRIPAGPALQMDLGGGRLEERCAQRGARFPGNVARRGVHTTVETAEASRDADRTSILRILSGMGDAAGAPPSGSSFSASNRRPPPARP